MATIPLIVGFGGINAAGRSSSHHGYRRMIIDALPSNKADETYQSLAALMNHGAGASLSNEQKQYLLDHSLIRAIESDWFDTENIIANKKMLVNAADSGISFTTKKRNLPEFLPENWHVTPLEGGQVQVQIHGESEFLVPSKRLATVRSAGQLPSGFMPGKLYPSRNHPRGLQMMVYGASDALGNLGIDWDLVCKHVPADKISVYAGSCMGQLDLDGHGGMLGSRFDGKRVTSKQCALGLAEMPADFINAYVLGTAGNTGASLGACASFLYNLRLGLKDIQTGAARVVVVGGSEAPITPDVMEGYIAMGALATDAGLMALDGVDKPDSRRSARPFSSNCGFTIAEASQCVVLFDDALAMELGATVYGAVTDVFVNADGHKKSISSPGFGNYLSVAKSMATARAILGEDALKKRSYVHAHGTSTPQNRVSESHILNEMAKTFGIEKWPVAAIKAYIGHSLGVSAGDQLVNCLGVWEHGVVPGIKTIDHVAEDVYDSNLRIAPEHLEVGVMGMDVTILNSKGFGGNNASAPILAPHIAEQMLEKKYGKQAFSRYKAANEIVMAQSNAYDAAARQGEHRIIYKFDHNVLSADDLHFDSNHIEIPGYEVDVDLNLSSPYQELLD